MNVEEDPGSTSLQVYAFPAVPLQERIWSLDTNGEPDPAWNVAVRFEVQGRLSIVRLQDALDAVVSDNEILRTRFSMIDGKLKQLVSLSSAVSIRLIDYSESLHFEQDLTDSSRCEAEATMCMHLYPLVRVVVVRRHADLHYLLVTAHHSIVDGYSIGLLSDALLAAYSRADRHRDKHPPSEQGFQFADYALWLAARRESTLYQEDAAYWTSALEGAPAVIPTPRSLRGKSRIDSLLLPRELTDTAQQLSGRLNATFPQTALAVFACAAGKLNTCVGIPVACRAEVQLESMIGPLVNYLPMSIPSASGGTFEQLLATIAESFREALEHGEYRYEDMLRAKGFTSQSLFDTIFICQRDFVRSRDVDGIQLHAMPSVSPGALQTLTVFLVERSDGWRLSSETDERLPAEYGSALLQRYKEVLQLVCDDPQRAIKTLWTLAACPDEPLPPTKKTAQCMSPVMSFRMSATQERYWALNRIDPGNSRLNLHMRYAVDGQLDRSAFKEALQQLTLRHASLRTYFSEEEGSLWQHVHPASKLPLRSHDDPEGVLNAEAVATIFDHEKQHAFQLEQGPLWNAFVVHSGTRTFFSMTLSHSIGDGWSCGLLVRELLALYNAMIAGRQLILPPLPISFGELADREFAERQTKAFDARLASWNTLLRGPSSRLQLPSDAVHRSSAPASVTVREIDPILSEAVNQLAKDHGVTAATAYTAAYRAVLLKYTGISDLVLVSPMANRVPGTEHIVGPFADSLLLQAAVGGTFEKTLQETQQAFLAAVEQAVPLQYLMERMRHSNAGNASAISLGFMYQDAFVRDLVGEHLTLRTMATPLVESSFDWHMAVITRDGKVTMEFAVTHGGMTEGLAAMILEDFELSLSGYVVAPRKQLDRIAGGTSRILQMCDLARQQKQEQDCSQQPSLVKNVTAQASAQTDEMVKVWQQVFDRSQIHGQDDFFALGGHSLLLARLQVAVEKQFGFRLFAADIFAAPTCHLLVERMARCTQNDLASNSRVIPIQPEGKETPLFIISQSMIIRELAEHLKPDQPVYTVQFMQEDVERLGSAATMQQVAALYIEHMRSSQPTGPYKVGGWCVSGWVAYEIAQQLSASGEEVQLLLILDAWAPTFWKNLRGVTRVMARMFYYVHRTCFIIHHLVTRKTGVASLGRFLTIKQMIRAKSEALLSYMTPKNTNSLSAEIVAFDTMMDAAIASYQALPYLDERVLVFRSSEQPRGGSLPDDMGWHSYVPSSVKIVSLPGDHIGIFSGQSAKTMAKCIVRDILVHPLHSSSHRGKLNDVSQNLINVPSTL